MAQTESDEMDQLVLHRTLKLVHKCTGITMGENKKTLLQGRLRKRIRELSLENYSQYIDYVEAHVDEVQTFVNLVTTNETSFFRTDRVWKFLSSEFLPEWFLQNKSNTLKIWSAAASTGEEVYTIGICCQEFKAKNPAFNYQVTGTDIDTSVLAVAEKAEYQGRSIELYKTTYKALFDKYMIPVESGYKVSDDVRSRIKFSAHNLFKPPAMKKHYDLIFLRNVLIYFEAQDQEKVLSNMGMALADSGLLVIGESESLTRLSTNFQFKAPLIYGRTGS
jgi:chemotaxis protein methyltransferase CheR